MESFVSPTRIEHGLVRRLTSWLFPAPPGGRAAVMRTAVYLFVLFDVLVVTSWAVDRGQLPADLYRPLFIARHFPVPSPGPVLVPVVRVALLICAAMAATGRLPRMLGIVVFVLYLEWMVIAFSYGKVDHDRFAILVALAVLPTVGGVRWGDQEADAASGWALRCIQVAVVLTYFLAALAKIRFGGIDWVNGATLMRAVLRRGTFLAEPLASYPWLLTATQYGIMAFELAAPLMLVCGRVGRLFLGAAVVFHVITYLFIRLIFLPHVICLLAFLPLERARAVRWVRLRVPGPHSAA
jgi:Vitamin K-dependent gamma-carboxylase